MRPPPFLFSASEIRECGWGSLPSRRIPYRRAIYIDAVVTRLGYRELGLRGVRRDHLAVTLGARSYEPPKPSTVASWSISTHIAACRRRGPSAATCTERRAALRLGLSTGILPSMSIPTLGRAAAAPCLSTRAAWPLPMRSSRLQRQPLDPVLDEHAEPRRGCAPPFCPHRNTNEPRQRGSPRTAPLYRGLVYLAFLLAGLLDGAPHDVLWVSHHPVGPHSVMIRAFCQSDASTIDRTSFIGRSCLCRPGRATERSAR